MQVTFTSSTRKAAILIYHDNKKSCRVYKYVRHIIEEPEYVGNEDL